uniref:KIAA0355 n=1 Tax=Eptatretus burgeri TaxID=7764 RepID=A0A8C4NIL3_EPTBU
MDEGDCEHATSSDARPSSFLLTAQAPTLHDNLVAYLESVTTACVAGSRLAASLDEALSGSPLAGPAAHLYKIQEELRVATVAMAGRLRAEIEPAAKQDGLSRGENEAMGCCLRSLVRFQSDLSAHSARSLSAVALKLGLEGVSIVGPLSLDLCSPSRAVDAVRTWQSGLQATAQLRVPGVDGCLVGREVQQLFCSQAHLVTESQLRELNSCVDSALQVYVEALERLDPCNFHLLAGFELWPEQIQSVLQDCCSAAEAQQAGLRQPRDGPVACELPCMTVQLPGGTLGGVPSSGPGASENLRRKLLAVRRLIEEASGGKWVIGKRSEKESETTSESQNYANGNRQEEEKQHNGNDKDVQSSMKAEEEIAAEILFHVCPSVWRTACKTAVQLLFGQAGLVVVDTAHTAQAHDREAFAPQISCDTGTIVVQVPSTWCVKEDPATMSLLRRWLDPEKTLVLVDVLYAATFDLELWHDGREQPLPSVHLQLRREREFASATPVNPAAATATAKAGGLQRTFSRLTSRFAKRASWAGAPAASLRDDKRTKPREVITPATFGSGKPPSSSSTRRAGDSRGCKTMPGLASYKSDPWSFALTDGRNTSLPSDREMQEVIDFLSGVSMNRPQTARWQVQHNERSTCFSNRGQVSSSSTTSYAPKAGSIPSQTWRSPRPSFPSMPFPTAVEFQRLRISGSPFDLDDLQLHNRPMPARNNTWPSRMQGDGACEIAKKFLVSDPAAERDPEYARYVANLAQVIQQQQQQQRDHHPVSPSPLRNWGSMPERAGPEPGPPWFPTRNTSTLGSSDVRWGYGEAESDATPPAFGCFSMFSGPDISAAVHSRRRHSSGEDKASSLLSSVLTPSADPSCPDKTHTWPLKTQWPGQAGPAAEYARPPPPSSQTPWAAPLASVFGPSLWSEGTELALSSSLGLGRGVEDIQCSPHMSGLHVTRFPEVFAPDGDHKGLLCSEVADEEGSTVRSKATEMPRKHMNDDPSQGSQLQSIKQEESFNDHNGVGEKSTIVGAW